MAFSASRASYVNQFFCLWCMSYLGPLFSSLSSSVVKVMFVLLINLGKNFCFLSGFVVCSFVSFAILLFMVWYLLLSFSCSSASIVSCMYGHVLLHSLARLRWMLYSSVFSRCFFCTGTLSLLLF
jgi:hypothetical protein